MTLLLKDLIINRGILKKIIDEQNQDRTSKDGIWVINPASLEWEHSEKFYHMYGELIEQNREYELVDEISLVKPESPVDR